MDKLFQHIQNKVLISSDSLEFIGSKFEEKHFQKKEYLLQSNNISRYVFFITNGCVRSYVIDYEGNEHNVFFSSENWWSGDLKSFLGVSPATYNVQALEKTTALCISKNNWDALISESPEFLKYSRILFRNNIIAQHDRIIQQLSLSSEERYNLFIQHYPQLINRIPQKHIALYLGITPQFLSMLHNAKKK